MSDGTEHEQEREWEHDRDRDRDRDREYTHTERMLQDILCDTRRQKERTVATYQWAICAIIGILLFVLGMQCQGERLNATVVRTEARVTALETAFQTMQTDLVWLRQNVATKQDIVKYHQ